MRKYLLLDKMTAMGYSKTDIAKQLELTIFTLNARLNGKIQFRYVEITKLCEILKIDDDREKAQIFLS